MFGFKNKTQLKEHLSGVLNSYNMGDIVSKTYDHNLILQVLRLHKDYDNKVGCGIKAFEIGSTRHSNRSRCFYIRRTDETREDFSYVKVLRGITTKKSKTSGINFHISEKKKKQILALDLNIPPKPIYSASDLIDTYDRSEKPIVGVYFLWNRSGEIFYVGKSRDIRSRLFHHSRIRGSYQMKDRTYDVFVSFVTLEDHEVDWMECLYIGIIKASENNECYKYNLKMKDS